MTAKLVGMYDWFLEEGLPVVVGYKGWETYGRPFLFDPRGSIAHHTASPTSSSVQANLNVVINGNSVAPGPISHCMLGRDLSLYLIATGRCNHAGAGWWPLGKDTGNMYGFAIESCNNGIGEYWRSEMVEIMGRAYAKVHRELSLPLDLAVTHAAYAPSRKIDPAGPAAFRQDKPGTWTLAEWQSLVGKYLNPTVPPVTPPPVTGLSEEEYMFCVVDTRDGKLWVGNGVQRYHVPTWQAWNVMYLRSVQGKLKFLNADGSTPTNPDSVLRTNDQAVIDSLGKALT